MKIIRKVNVSQVITEKSKDEIRNHFQALKRQLDQECQQLTFEMKKLEGKKGVSKQDVHKRFQQEIKKRREKAESMAFRLNQLELLPLGSEITVQEVEALVEVEEGMQWQDIMEGSKIVIRDGVVVRIE